MIEAIVQERNDDIAIDSLKACRSGKNTIKPQQGRSGGICSWMTLSGFCIELKEYIHRETPTEIILDTVTALTKGPARIQYFQRMESLGYDSMCNLIKRVLKLARRGLLSKEVSHFWSQMLLRTFSDKFHVAKHVCPLCALSSGNCLLNPALPKFKEVFKTNEEAKINDEVKFFMCHT